MYYKEFAVGGEANTTVLDDGLKSTTIEKKRIIEVWIMHNEAQGNTVEGWIGTERVLTIMDYLFDTNDDQASGNAQRSTTKVNKIPVNIEIPDGATFKIGIRCGANATNIYGSYQYEAVA